MDYNFREIEAKWQEYWKAHQTYRITEDETKEKFYILDMFPYPSGAGLHVGHPLGYIASDIFARYKRLKGFNVLHPMGYDAFGLPAEQYAIQTGQHPSKTTEENVQRYRKQLDRLGFSFDWSREIRTCDPSYYKWTQWIFLQLFDSWYDRDSDRAESIDKLIEKFSISGTEKVNAVTESELEFSAEQWNSFEEVDKQSILLDYRLAYLSETVVNWCPDLGTVLANEEVKDGLSERGGYPVERKLMQQWSLRITAYADRLLAGLDEIDWPEAIKEAQRNWIGRSEGVMLKFRMKNRGDNIEVFTTRPDTIFGATFMVLAPEHELVDEITSREQKEEVKKYREYAKSRSERERMAETRNITGAFTGNYVQHPFTGAAIPVWISEYVLAGYGTGAVMAVPAHDSRDHAFARHFGLAIKEVVSGGDVQQEAYDAKEGKLINSDFLNDLDVKEAIEKAGQVIEDSGLGIRKVNYRLRDAVFGRQRYWGEPIPVYFRNGMPYPLSEDELPLMLPEVDKFLPTESGEPPLARARDWKYNGEYHYELTTMPGWAGSSWYYLRYMDPGNEASIVSTEALRYWKQVDLYIGGSEHATGHLLYVRFWTKFLRDRGHISISEPARKLINQGMIQGTSCFVYRETKTGKFISHGLKDDHETTPIHVDVNLVNNRVLDMDGFRGWRDEYKHAEFVLENGEYIVGTEVEKMSKSKWNVVSPDDIVEHYGADCLRLYEMFLGPLEQSKPWNTNGITGVFSFLRKLWKLYHQGETFSINNEKATPDELKVLHRTIKKVSEDIERFSFNTTVSTFMICVNELSELKCDKREILEPLIILLSPYAPHICEELWHMAGHEGSVMMASFPIHDEAHLVEDIFEYPVSFNGKTRFKVKLELSLDKDAVAERILGLPDAQKWLEGKTPRKVIVVSGRIVNIVV
jgi:leucyl-tRNA synthetase